MRVRNPIYLLFVVLLTLTGCQEPTHYDYSVENHNESVQAAFAKAAEAGRACRIESGEKQNFRRYSCVNEMIDRDVSPVATDQKALRVLKNNMLNLAKRLDKKQISPDKETTLIDQYIDQFVKAETAAQALLAQRVEAVRAIERQNENLRQQEKDAKRAEFMGYFMQDLGRKMEQRYAPKPQINCQTITSGMVSTTHCQ